MIDYYIFALRCFDLERYALVRVHIQSHIYASFHTFITPFRSRAKINSPCSPSSHGLTPGKIVGPSVPVLEAAQWMRTAEKVMGKLCEAVFVSVPIRGFKGLFQRKQVYGICLLAKYKYKCIEM